MMTANALSIAALLFGAGLVAMILFNLFRARSTRRASPKAHPIWRDRTSYILGIAFGATWAAAAISHRPSRPEWWMQAAAGILIATLYLVFLLASTRPDRAHRLGLGAWQTAVPTEGDDLDVELLARSGDTIRAVRAYRARTGASLRDAVAAVRAIQQEGEVRRN